MSSQGLRKLIELPLYMNGDKWRAAEGGLTLIQIPASFQILPAAALIYSIWFSLLIFFGEQEKK